VSFLLFFFHFFPTGPRMTCADCDYLIFILPSYPSAKAILLHPPAAAGNLSLPLARDSPEQRVRPFLLFEGMLLVACCAAPSFCAPFRHSCAGPSVRTEKSTAVQVVDRVKRVSSGVSTWNSERGTTRSLPYELLRMSLFHLIALFLHQSIPLVARSLSLDGKWSESPATR
jgi:hypothetical protein